MFSVLLRQMLGDNNHDDHRESQMTLEVKKDWRYEQERDGEEETSLSDVHF